MSNRAPQLFVTADVGGPGHYHLGDEAMLEANLRMFRQFVPGVQFTVPSRDPSWTATRYGVQSLSSRHLRDDGERMSPRTRVPADGSRPCGTWAEWLGEALTERVRDADGLVISGGGNLCETWPGHIWERVALIEVARAAGRPAVVLGQTLGPGLSADQRRLLADSLSSCAWVGVRDRSSAALALDLGVPSARLHQQLDDAFFLDPVPVHDHRAAALARTAPPWILITLDASFGSPDRARSMDRIAGQLDALAASLRATLVFAPHVAGADIPDTLADATAAGALRARLRSPLLVLDAWQPGEMRWLVGQAALVISSRYHPLIFAAAACIPSLGIHTDAYTRTKLRGALAPAGLEGWCISVADTERQALFPVAMELWHQRHDVHERLARLGSEAWPGELIRWDGICRALRLDVERTTSPPVWDKGAPLAALATRAVKRDASVKKGVTTVPAFLTDEQWWEYQQQGYLRLGPIVGASRLDALQQLMNGIMLGRIRNPALEFQLDTGGRLEDLPDPARGLTTPTPMYRKVQGLESEPLMLDLIRHDLFRDICARQYGRHANISIFRAMMMNEPAHQGTHLPWHQDAGDVWKLDRDPLVTTWIALDAATRANGCLEVVPGSHKLGLLNRHGSTISASQAETYCPDAAVTNLEVEAGDVILMHNWLLHRSGVNQTDAPRRALTVCYMDGRTLSTVTGNRFPIVFGEPEDIEDALPFVKVLNDQNRGLQAAAAEAQRYALSLLEDNQRREQMRLDAATYAQSLEAELGRVSGKPVSSAG